MVEVKLLPEAQQELLEMQPIIRKRVRKITDRLEQWPNVSGAKPLHGALAGQFRIRTGGYRVQFYHNRELDVIFIVHIGYRKGFYE